MNFYDALEILKRGGIVERSGRKYKLARGGLYDVSTEELERIVVGEKERAATDWQASG